MLKRCSDAKDITEWNQWRKNNPIEDIELEGGEFDGCYLSSAFFNKGTFEIGGKKTHFKGDVCLKGAKFRGAELQGVIFHNAIIQNTRFANAYLQKAIFQGSHLQDANFYKAKLQGTNFKWAFLNNATSFIEVEIDEETDFDCTGLNGVRISPATKQLIEYNVRRMNWEQWYKKGCWLKRFLKKLFIKHFFWALSDYGRSTGKIVAWFFGLAFVFAGIYYLCALMNPPGIVNSLITGKEGTVPAWLLPFRSIYFSIVTMTTLGFGDMHANCQSFWGHLLLTFQVILGYVLLGALITRFAVLFTAGGPAGRFADEKTILDRLRQLWTKLKGRNAKRK